jgi:hypothetical protein
MRRLLNGIMLFSLAAVSGFADLFQGAFTADNQVEQFSITATTDETLTIVTYSYAGGTVGSTVIPAGGFAPTAFLYDNVGGVQTITNGTCNQVGRDPTTGNCDDLYFRDLLTPGTYTLALAVYENTPVDTSVADGFVEDADPGFTCADAGTTGNFCDLTDILGPSRTGNYAISITTTPVPEPGSTLLLLTGAALAGLLRLRSSKSR